MIRPIIDLAQNHIINFLRIARLFQQRTEYQTSGQEENLGEIRRV